MGIHQTLFFKTGLTLTAIATAFVPDTAIVGVDFASNGVRDVYWSGTNGSSTGDGNWYTPTTTGIGSSFWIRADGGATGFGYTGITPNTWISLSTSRSIRWDVSTNIGVQYQTVNIDISSSSTGTPIVESYILAVSYDRFN